MEEEGAAFSDDAEEACNFCWRLWSQKVSHRRERSTERRECIKLFPFVAARVKDRKSRNNCSAALKSDSSMGSVWIVALLVYKEEKQKHCLPCFHSAVQRQRQHGQAGRRQRRRFRCRKGLHPKVVYREDSWYNEFRTSLAVHPASRHIWRSPSRQL